MSKIIAKPFDAAKRIITAIFRGEPNLFTTEDLNRQFENVNHRLCAVEDTSNPLWGTICYVDDDAKNLVLTRLMVRGCLLYEGEAKYYPLSENRKYIRVTYGVVDFASDLDHEISGAKFEDGTTLPAADHKVIKQWEVVSVSDNGTPGHTSDTEYFKLYERKDVANFTSTPRRVHLIPQSLKLDDEVVVLKETANVHQKTLTKLLEETRVQVYTQTWSLSDQGDDFAGEPVFENITVDLIKVQNLNFLKIGLYNWISGQNETLRINFQLNISSNPWIFLDWYCHYWAHVTFEQGKADVEVSLNRGVLSFVGVIKEDYKGEILIGCAVPEFY